MNLSAECKEAIREHGLLLNEDSSPAGASLMRKLVLSVALIQNEAMPKDISDHMYPDREAPDMSPDALPDKGWRRVKAGIDFWYDGNIKFVKPHENPDLRVVVMDMKISSLGGRASFPVSDSEWPGKSWEYKDPYIVLNIPSLRTVEFGRDPMSEKIEKLTRHEFGHVLGVFHTTDVFEAMQAQDPSTCNLDKKDEDPEKDFVSMSTLGSMNTIGTDSQPNEVDEEVRSFLQGSAPSLSPMKR